MDILELVLFFWLVGEKFFFGFERKKKLDIKEFDEWKILEFLKFWSFFLFGKFERTFKRPLKALQVKDGA